MDSRYPDVVLLRIRFLKVVSGNSSLDNIPPPGSLGYRCGVLRVCGRIQRDDGSMFRMYVSKPPPMMVDSETTEYLISEHQGRGELHGKGEEFSIRGYMGADGILGGWLDAADPLHSSSELYKTGWCCISRGNIGHVVLYTHLRCNAYHAACECECNAVLVTKRKGHVSNFWPTHMCSVISMLLCPPYENATRATKRGRSIRNLVLVSIGK